MILIDCISNVANHHHVISPLSSLVLVPRNPAPPDVCAAFCHDNHVYDGIK